ncbi:MFS transporter [Planomonospora venezuelensis]|uniref:MFS family permease n=1 Tax=Planomonospora venezuelensis TaxID=1999 RepID=A0A841D032_PLAVE|nr:MFS family permease [Planomonospora venezuelensis]
MFRAPRAARGAPASGPGRAGRAVVAGTRQARRSYAVFSVYPSFRSAWLGSALSMLGTRTLGVTYPLLAFWLTGSPAWTGWVVFASTVPGLLCYIPAGVLVDRLGRRRVMMWSEAGRALLVGAVCAGLLHGSLRGADLVAVALAEGVLFVTSTVAETALIPATVHRRDVDTALAVHETTVHAVVLAGRPLGGLLYGLGPLTPFLANAAVFACASAAFARLPREEDPRPKETFPGGIRSGLREVWENRFLRSATVLTALANLVVQALIVVFLSGAASTGVHPAVVGLTLAASGVGGAFGAFISPARRRISRKIDARAARGRWTLWLAEWLGLSRRGRSMLLVHVLTCCGALGLTVALGQGPPVVGAALLVIGLAGGLSNVTIRTVLSQVPEDRVAKVVSVSRLGSYGAVALGPLLAGVLVANVTAATAVLILFGLMSAVALAAALVPVFRRALSPRLVAGNRQVSARPGAARMR